MEPDRSPAQFIAQSEGLLLDFDGPVCDVYAGSDPARIAREVAATFQLDIRTDDPLDLITHALATNGPVDAIHRRLTETEIEAVDTADETPGIRQLIETYDGPIAIVSNNAAEAIDVWLTKADLRSLVTAVVGRDPRCMKPNPRPILDALKVIDRRLEDCLFIGDSLSDIRAGEAAGIKVIALANRTSKETVFRAENHGTVVNKMTELIRQ